MSRFAFSPRLAATGLLLAVTAVWGSTFPLIKQLLLVVPALDFLALRFLIAAAIMALLFWRHVRSLRRAHLLAGVFLGALYGVAQVAQTVGLGLTSASISGFVTGTYVVLTPVFGAVALRQRPPARVWVAVTAATLGLASLSLGGGHWGGGEWLTLAAAALYAGHILALSAWSTPETAVGLATVQAAVIAFLCLAAAAPGGVTMPPSASTWAMTLYMALVAGALALWAQTWAQSRLNATRAAIVMTMEPVFAAAFAVIIGHESLTARVLIGGALVVGAMVVSELGSHDPQATASQDPPIEGLHHEV